MSSESPKTTGIQQRSLLSNQIKSLLLSHHHSTSALVSEILMSVLQTVQKNRQFTYGQTVQKKQTKKNIYIWTDSAKNCTGAFTVLQTVQKKTTTAIYIWTDSAKKQQTINKQQQTNRILSLTHRDFSSFSESFDDVMHCR